MRSWMSVIMFSGCGRPGWRCGGGWRTGRCRRPPPTPRHESRRLPEQTLDVVGTAVVSGTRGGPPAFAGWELGDDPPASSCERRPRFAGLGVGDESPVAECFGGPPRCRVEHRIGVRGAVSAGPVDLERQPVVEVACDRTADHRDPDERVTDSDPDGKLVADGGLVMAVMRCYKGCGIREGDGYEVQGHDRHSGQQLGQTTRSHPQPSAGRVQSGSWGWWASLMSMDVPVRSHA